MLGNFGIAVYGITNQSTVSFTPPPTTEVLYPQYFGGLDITDEYSSTLEEEE